jgi:hypothetical protein
MCYAIFWWVRQLIFLRMGFENDISVIALTLDMGCDLDKERLQETAKTFDAKFDYKDVTYYKTCRTCLVKLIFRVATLELSD